MRKWSQRLAIALLWAHSTAGFAQSGEARIGGVILSTRQNVLGAGGGVVRSSGTLSGFEFLARSDMAGLYGRYLTGTVGTLSARGQDGRLKSAEIRIMIGPQVLSIEGGYELRARSGSLGEPRDALFRGGARSTVWLGPSGLSLSLSVGALGRSDSSGTTKKFGLIGWEGSTAVLYQAPKGIPLYAMLGYRYERFRTEMEPPPVQREELGSIVFGVGIRHLNRAKEAVVQIKP